MIVTRLKLANVRAVEAAEFSFKPGFNLIIGVNGVGKTSALESLAVSLAAISRHINSLKGPLHGFTSSDIRARTDALTVESEVSIADKPYSYVIHQPREEAVAQAGKEGLPREQTVATPAKSAFVGDNPPAADGKKVLHPLAVLFSTRRAVPSDRAPTKSAAKGGHAAAFAEAFSARELRLGEFAAWMRAQGALAAETPSSARVLDAFEKAVRRFLPGYANLRVSDEATPRLLIERRGVEIPVRQLSDGERGSLALVLDLTRRLAQANPGLDDPAAKGPGVVLIDEIDLHLHPKWQREIVRNLPDAFPKLQFIATTHSPQVIGEVEHDRIQVMGRGPVFSPTHSFGVDSSRVLEEIMDAPPRSHAPRFPRRRGMRAITKGQEPRSLVEHRANAHCDYANYADKDGLRAALVREQRGLCCYCMTRVEATGTGMKIEHWRCQSRNADLELTYSNLLAACLGGHGQPEALQHCDTRKGEQDLKFNPANGAHRIEQRIRFEMDGTIASGDADFNAQLNDVLNLNLPLLKNRRKGVLTAILEWWKSEKARLRGPVPTEQLARERARRAGAGAGQLTPFDPVAVWWLDQRLARSET